MLFVTCAESSSDRFPREPEAALAETEAVRPFSSCPRLQARAEDAAKNFLQQSVQREPVPNAAEQSAKEKSTLQKRSPVRHRTTKIVTPTQAPRRKGSSRVAGTTIRGSLTRSSEKPALLGDALHAEVLSPAYR